MNWQKLVFFFHNFTCDIYNFYFFYKWPDNLFSTHERGTWNRVKCTSSHVNSTFHNLLFSHKRKIPPVKFTFSHVNGIHLYVIGIFSHVDLNFQRCKQSMAHEVRWNVFLHVGFFSYVNKKMLHVKSIQCHMWTGHFHSILSGHMWEHYRIAFHILLAPCCRCLI